MIYHYSNKIEKRYLLEFFGMTKTSLNWHDDLCHMCHPGVQVCHLWTVLKTESKKDAASSAITANSFWWCWVPDLPEGYTSSKCKCSRSLFSSVVVVAGLLQHGLSTPDPVLRTSHGLCKLSYTLKYCDGHKASQIGTELQLRTEKLFQLAILQHKGRICI